MTMEVAMDFSGKGKCRICLQDFPLDKIGVIGLRHQKQKLGRLPTVVEMLNFLVCFGDSKQVEDRNIQVHFFPKQVEFLENLLTEQAEREQAEREQAEKKERNLQALLEEFGEVENVQVVAVKPSLTVVGRIGDPAEPSTPRGKKRGAA